MIYLLDTHVLLCAGEFPEKLSDTTAAPLGSYKNQRLFSTVSIWEVAINFGQGRPDFQMPPSASRQDLFSVGYQEIRIRSDHAIAVATLPPIHKDPFDRLLIAQAVVEGIVLLTAGPEIAKYPGPIQLV